MLRSVSPVVERFVEHFRAAPDDERGRRQPTNHWRLIARSLPAAALHALRVVHASKAGCTDVPRHRNPR